MIGRCERKLRDLRAFLRERLRDVLGARVRVVVRVLCYSAVLEGWIKFHVNTSSWAFQRGNGGYLIVEKYCAVPNLFYYNTHDGFA